MIDAKPRQPLLSDDEMERLIMATVEGHTLAGQQGATRQQIDAVLAWAEQTRVDMTFLSLILKGEVAVTHDGGRKVTIWARKEDRP